jgi:hypothetical protein
MERTHIPLHKWLRCFYLMTASKNGISAYQLQRTIKISYKSAWFMRHRVREAMRAGRLAPAMGFNKTFGSRKKDMSLRTGYEHKHAFLSLMD